MQGALGGIFGGGSGGGSGGAGGRRGGTGPIFLILALGLLLWVGWPGSGWYLVQPDEQGVVLRFGKYERTETPGFKLKLPVPFETVALPRVTRVNEVTVGFVNSRRGGEQDTRDVLGESLMLTGDENIVDIDFSVFWLIKDAKDFLFNVRDPEGAVKAVAESAMREIVGKNNLEPIITRGREVVEQDTKDLIQETLDEYGAGILITQVQLAEAGPPERVIAAFRDVVNAGQEKVRSINEATAYRNQVVPEARGNAARLIQEAEGYRDSVIAESTGEAERFRLILEQYRLAPEVTRRRMYLETMEKVLERSDKIVIDGDSGEGVVPYLPLNELRRSEGGR